MILSIQKEGQRCSAKYDCRAKGHHCSLPPVSRAQSVNCAGTAVCLLSFPSLEKMARAVTLPNPSIKLPKASPYYLRRGRQRGLERLCPELASLLGPYEQPWSCPLAWLNEVWSLGKGGSSCSPMALPQGSRLLQPLHQLAHLTWLTRTRQEVYKSPL